MDTLIQIVFNSIISSLLLSLVAIGFTFIFRITNVFHLAHAGIYTTGAFCTWWLMAITNNWLLAISLSTVTVSLIIYCIEKTIYLPLNKNQSNQSISLIASMGIYIIIINTLAQFFGNENKVFENPMVGSYTIENIIITKIQVIQTIVSAVTICSYIIYLKVSKSEVVLHAIADNETIAKILGINTETQRTKTIIIGSVLAAIAAILKTLETGIDPHAGMSITLTASVIAILVSRTNVFFIVIFSILLSLIQNSVEWFLNAQWKDGITFLILLLVILFRTEGIISYNLRKDRV